MSYDVVVIGGGFAGLSAAVELAGRGVRVALVEARPSLGGRATAFTDPATAELVDNGQHVLFGCYRETFRFLQRIGTVEQVRMQPDLDVTFIDQRGRLTRLRSAQAPAPWHLLGGLLEWEALDIRDRLELLRLVPAIRRAIRHARGDHRIVAASPDETVENWLIRNGQGRRIRELLWEPLALAALNQHPSRAAAPAFARVLADLSGSARRDSAIGLPTRPLDRLYAEPARAYIEACGGLIVSGAAARVLHDGTFVRAVDARGRRIDGQAFIVAVPWFGLADVLSEWPPGSPLDSIVSAASKMSSSPIVTVNLWFDRAVLDVPFVGLPGRTMQWVFDKRFAFGAEASHLSAVSSGAEQVVSLTNDELVALARKEIVDALPGARGARLVRATAVRERQATFSLAPGQPARPGTTTLVPNLFLAGDWIATGLPGTIESAVLSGHRAAQAAYERLGGA